MSKKNDSNLNNIYNSLVEVLSIVFLNKQTINIIKTDTNVEKAVIDLLNVCNQLEIKLDIADKDKKINEFKSAFETINNNKKIRLSKVNVDDEDNILDKINYLKIILKNSHNLDWVAILNSLNYKSNIKNDQEVVDAQKTNINYTDNHEEIHYKDSADFLRQNNISIDDITDNIIKQQAINLLNSDIVSNKFYQFDSKPKIFKILKYLMFGLWLFAFLAFFILIIFGFILRDKYFAFEQLPTSSITYEQFLNGYGLKWWGIGNNLMTALLPALLIVVSLFFVVHFIFNQIKYFKNDNIQYAFKSSISWFYVIFVLIYILLPIFLDVKNSILTIFKNIDLANNLNISGELTVTNIPNSSSDVTIKFDNASNFAIFQAYYVLTIFCIVLAGIILITTIVMMVIKPKLDVNRINKKIEEYYSDIKSGKIRVNNDYSGGGMFGNSPWKRNPFSPW